LVLEIWDFKNGGIATLEPALVNQSSERSEEEIPRGVYPEQD